MITNCRKSNTNRINGKVERAHYSSFEEKVDDLPRKECENRQRREEKAAKVDIGGIAVNGGLPALYALYSESTCNERSFEKNMEQKNSNLNDEVRLGELSVGKVRTVEEAISYNRQHHIKALNLALFPSSCAPPTLAHEKIMAQVLDLPFVDQVWVDVNYKSYTKQGLQHFFKERLEMIKLVVADKSGYDYCTLSKDTKVGEWIDREYDSYFMVARALIGTGTLSWVVGGDVISNMVFWKERAKENLLQVDRLIICTRGKTEEEIEDKLHVVFGSKENFREFSNKVCYIHTTADISSTAAREGLRKILRVVSPRILMYIISQSHIFEEYFNEFRHTSR